MANQMYNLAKDKFLSAQIDLLTHNIKVLLIDGADYVPNFNTDEFHANIPAAAIVGTSANLAGKTLTLGVFNADPVQAASVSGDTFEHLILYRDTGSSATSPLILFIENPPGTPYIPIGSNVFITWDSGPAKIFRLGDCL